MALDIPNRRERLSLQIGIPCALFFGCLAIYGQTLGFDFVNFDDDAYVYANKWIADGFTWQNIQLAFTSNHAQLWHPLATISHLIDVELFGSRPGWSHLINVLLHTANSILLYFALARMTSRWWASGLAAALFAFHPLRVESVAWISERKDVLSGFFFMLVLLSYTAYVRKPSIRSYLPALIFVFCGLMSKPSFVTVPFLLWLLDWWPLKRDLSVESNRERRKLRKRMALEKLPMIIGSVAVCFITVNVQEKAIRGDDFYPIGLRLQNAIVSYATYLGQTLWPSNLCVFYPFPDKHYAWWIWLGAAILIVSVLHLGVEMRRRRRFLLVGWLWFLGMLVPNIGIIQAGNQAHADRFTYLPGIGLALIVAWGVYYATDYWERASKAIVTAACAVLLVLGYLSWRQTQTWSDGVTLFSRAVEISPNDAMLCNNLGNALTKAGRREEAEVSYRRACELAPDDVQGFINLGQALKDAGRWEEAAETLGSAMAIESKNGLVLHGLGLAMLQLGRFDTAVEYFETAEKSDPQNVDVLINLGLVRAKQTRFAEAEQLYRRALAIEPNSAVAAANLGIVLLQLDRQEESLEAFRASLIHRPDHVETLRSAAWLTSNMPGRSDHAKQEALGWAEKALKLSPSDDPILCDVVAAAYANVGRFEEAVRAARKGIEHAQDAGNYDLAYRIKSHLQRYELGMTLLD